MAWSSELVTRFQNGKRFKRAGFIPDEMWNLITRCWHQDPLRRPTFDEIAKELEDIWVSGTGVAKYKEYQQRRIAARRYFASAPPAPLPAVCRFLYRGRLIDIPAVPDMTVADIRSGLSTSIFPENPAMAVVSIGIGFNEIGPYADSELWSKFATPFYYSIRISVESRIRI
jgi:hypothetical protein